MFFYGDVWLTIPLLKFSINLTQVSNEIKKIKVSKEEEEECKNGIKLLYFFETHLKRWLVFTKMYVILNKTKQFSVISGEDEASSAPSINTSLIFMFLVKVVDLYVTIH